MRNLCLWMLAIGLVLAGARVSFAQYHHHQNGGSNNNSGSKNNAPPAPAPPASQPSAPPTQLSIDDSALKSAADALSKDQQALQAIYDAAWQKYQQSSDWADLQAKLTAAQAGLDSAKQASKDALANNSDYQDAVAAKKKASDALEADKASGDTDPNTLGPLAEANLQATLNLRKIEQEVQLNDTGVQTATDKLAVAQHDVDMGKLKFQQALSLDKNYIAAEQGVAAAQRQYDALRQKVAADNGSSGDN